MPKLSFVVPYFDKLNSVEKCLKSLFDQSVKDNIEVIVVKDGPDIEADKIFKKFEKKHKAKFKVIEIPHGGACAARNAGLDLAQGDYVCFWDADSYIESGAAAVWLGAFNLNDDADFVYAGYRFPEGFGGIASEPFDPWTLKVSNYISGHFPIKREKCPRWDTSLKSLQDWDFWLQAVEKGCKGHFLRGYAFMTDAPGKGSISGIGNTDENWLPRRDAVKEKHGLPDREMCVVSIGAQAEATELAKILDADFSNFLTTKPNRYKTIVQLGFDPKNADACAALFHDPKNQVRKILFWRGSDVQALLHEAAFSAVEALALLINRSVHYQFCEDKVTQEYLNRLGFKAVPFPLPLKAETPAPWPKEFKVLLDYAFEFTPFFDGLKRAMPDVTFEPFGSRAKPDEYSVFIQYQTDKSLGTNVKKMLLNGRHVVSNIQAPLCGFISDTQPLEQMRVEMVRRLRELQAKGPNDGAVKYYSEISSPERFKKVFSDLFAPKPEAVAA